MNKKYKINLHGKEIEIEQLPNGKFKKPEFITKQKGIHSSISPLKQTTEIWNIYRKPFKHKTIIQDILAYEDGDKTITPSGLNIDAGRVPTSEDKDIPIFPKEEIWKTIEEYPDYQISTYGRVKSFKGKESKILAINKDRGGYCRAKINSKYISIHRLVAIHFLPNVEDKPEVNHKNSIRDDNNVNNLEWSTKLENIYHSIDEGEFPKSFKPKTILQFSIDGVLLGEYRSRGDISREFNINGSHITDVCNGKMKQTLGYIWVYLEDYPDRKLPDNYLTEKEKQRLHKRYPAQLFLDGKINYTREEIDLDNKDFLEFIGIDSDVIQYMDKEKAIDYICNHLDKFDVSKLLDEQSGITKSTGGTNPIRRTESSSIASGGGMNKIGQPQNQSQNIGGLGDTGGSSRVLHNSGFTLTELYQHIYYSKASSYERSSLVPIKRYELKNNLPIEIKREIEDFLNGI